MKNLELLKQRQNELIDIDELTNYLNISQMSVYRLRYKGELQPKTKWGGKNYWNVNEVLEYCINKGIISA
jgi:predicted DNA-binding transcriptional regulator AlpA